jgi:arylsulfatase A-like enzyme
MRRWSLSFAVLSFIAVLSATAVPAATRPNFLIILADDLGYSDIGCYGGEIETPNLDGLAKGGLQYLQFYNTARCWPTRGALLTGYYAQQIRRDAIPGSPEVKGGNGGKRPAWAHLLPEMLKSAGYRSYHSGKWHVDGGPIVGGFDHSYWVDDTNRHFSPNQLFNDDEPLPAINRNTGYYSTVAIADHAIAQLKDHAAKHAKQPFFEYLAFIVPHFPIQALPEDIDRYRERYKAGWENVRRARWEKVKALDVNTGSLADVEFDIGPRNDRTGALEKVGPGEIDRPQPWSELNEAQAELQATKMAIHAAMVDRMDREIGRVLEQVRAMGAWDNTVIMFLSDNGASAEIMVRGDGHDREAPLGSAGSFVCLGPGWSTVSNTPFRRHKTWVFEGGISTPYIVHWPKGIAARGETRHNVGHVIDIVPTILELANAKKPSSTDAPAPPGKSLTQSFTTDNSVGRDSLWWYHQGSRALRVGDVKIVADEGEPWELYDLNGDRAESKNLAKSQPEKVDEMSKLWDAKLEEFRADATRAK